jgi:uncharacterized protein (TIGR02246 family)
MAIAAKSELETLKSLNRDYVQSVQRSDVARFEEILADDFLCTNPDGSLVGRAAFLEQVARPATIRNLEAHDVTIRHLGDVAIVHARTTYVAPDGSAGRGRYTDVWARRDGRWLAVAAHVTRG